MVRRRPPTASTSGSPWTGSHRAIGPDGCGAGARPAVPRVGTPGGPAVSLIGIAEIHRGRVGLQADWAAVVDDWRRAYQPAMDRVRDGGAWRDLDALQRETLADVLAGTASRSARRPGITGQGLAAAEAVAGQPGRARSPAPQAHDRVLSNGHLAPPARPAEVRRSPRRCPDLGVARRRRASPTPRSTSPRCFTVERQLNEAGMVAGDPPDLDAAAALACADLHPPPARMGARRAACGTRPRWRACSKPTGSPTSPRRWAADREATWPPARNRR